LITMWRLRILLTAALILGVACDDVTFVERIVIVNETEYDTNVDVRGSSGGWLGLSMVPAHVTREVREVIDQGQSWTFRFSYGSHEPVEFGLSRKDLVEADWRVEVPDELEIILRAEGVPPPP
jgi:hypothetical protein